MVVSLSSGVFGTYNGLISTLVYSVVHDSEGISATLEEASWIGRLIYLLSSKLNHLTIVFFLLTGCLAIMGQIFGSLSGGIIAASIGRIKTLFLSGIPIIICLTILTSLANSLWHIYLAMFFACLSSSAAHTVVGEVLALLFF